MRKFSTSAAGVLLALVGLAMVGTLPAFAYASQGTSGATLSSSSGPCGTTVTFTATFKDGSGNPVVGSTVVFSQQSGAGSVTFGSTTGTTDANGKASTTVTFPSNCSGQYVLAASTQGVTVNSTFSVSAATAGLPAAGGARAAVPANGPPVLALVLGLLGVVIVAAGATAMVRNRA